MPLSRVLVVARLLLILERGAWLAVGGLLVWIIVWSIWLSAHCVLLLAKAVIRSVAVPRWARARGARIALTITRPGVTLGAWGCRMLRLI